MLISLPVSLPGTAPCGHITLVASILIAQCQGRKADTHRALCPQPHENAVRIQLDEDYRVRSGPPEDVELKLPRGLVGSPILHTGQHAEKAGLR